MEIHLCDGESKKSQEKQTGMLYLFKADIDCTGLEDSMTDGKTSVFTGKKSIELLQVI